jgi:nicotinamidase-related amidase
LNPDEVIESRLWPDHCVQGTNGEKLVPGVDWEKCLTRIDGAILADLEKDSESFNYTAIPSSSSNLAIIKKGLVPTLEQYSAFTPPFTNPPLHAAPRLTRLLKAYAITHVYVIGLAYDYCVKETALDAVRQGFDTFVVEEGTRAVDGSEKNLEKVRRELREGGVCVLQGELEGIEELGWVRDEKVI